MLRDAEILVKITDSMEERNGVKLDNFLELSKCGSLWDQI